MLKWLLHILLLLLLLVIIVQVDSRYETNQKQNISGRRPLMKKPLCECGKSNSKRTRIIGGEKLSKRKYPWLVFVNGHTQSCTGSLISRRHVISAAHCVHTGKKWLPKKGWKVTIGDHNLFKTTDNLKSETITMAATVIKHPKYNFKNQDYDIILLKLKSSLKLPSFKEVRPICLPESESNNYINVDAICAGWGDTSPTSSKMPAVPSEISLKTLNNECQGYDVTQNMICTEALWKKATPFIGDSGGPLMVYKNGRYVLIGIVSQGQTMNDEVGAKAVAVYTKVTKVLPWILKNTNRAIICK